MSTLFHSVPIAPATDWFRLHDPDRPPAGPALSGGGSGGDSRQPPQRSDAKAQPPTAGGQPHIPGYEILGELGRGGMGVVYKARQKSLNRIVALKMLPAGSHPAHLARFRAEAEVIARLQHPHIVQIYEVGEYDGLPYFTLEYVDGGHLGDRLEATGPQPPALAAALVETLARTVHIAHERGIIHRDLKPANVLLTSDGTPKIADFGLAKRLEDDSNLTRSGVLLGTPAYVAPEQLGATRSAPGAIGPAVDVYALGVILYECLTGRPPFVGASPADLLFQVTLREPLSPSYWARQTPRALETICLKCLEKEPCKRYAGADKLADDLAAFGRGRPIKAHPVGPLGRCLRWCRKRRLVAALTAALGALLLTTLVALSLGFLRIQSEQERTDAARRAALASAQQVRVALRREGRRRRQARTALDALTSAAVDDLLAGLPRLEERHRQLLRTAERLYQEQLAEAEPGDRLDTARAHLRLAKIRYRLGEHNQAERSYRQAVLLFGQLLAESGLPQRREELAAVHDSQARFFKSTSRPARAEAEHLRARALRARLVSDAPHEPRYRKALAQTDCTLGILRVERNRHAEAEKAFRRCLTLRLELAGERPRDPVARMELAHAHNNLALLLMNRNRYTESAQQYRAARAAYQALHKEFPHQAHFRNLLADAHNNLGIFYQHANRFRDAEKEYRAALPIRITLARQFPAQPEYATDLGGVYCNLAELTAKTGHREESLTWYEQAQRVLHPLHVRLPHLERTKRFLLNVHWSRARTLTDLGRHAEALPDWERAVTLCAPIQRDHLRLRRATSLLHLGQPSQALTSAAEIDLARTPPVELAHLAAAFCASTRSADSALRQRLLQRALSLIRAAHKSGLFRQPGPAGWLQKEARLAPLRRYPEFRNILTDASKRVARPPHPAS
jgi:serine/threonine-protein kinase